MDKENLMDSWINHIAPSSGCSISEMEKRVARFNELPKSPRAFADTYLSGHERTLFSVIGSGVTDNPSFKPKINSAENFHVDFIVAPKGCGAAMHWHDSEEVFIAQSGNWAIDWLDGSTEMIHTITLEERDTISVPPFVHRAFRSLDGEKGLLISILGGKTPNPVKWHENVAKQAVSQGVIFDGQGIEVKISN
jgi:mannose-6-phosphate isomerase-like protein (cupin superfamily)